MWAEANRYATAHELAALSALRKLVYQWSDALAVPGQLAEETIRNDWRITSKPFIRLPNIVDERLYRDEVDALRAQRTALRARFDLGPQDLVLLLPARLHEGTKGIVRFLNAIRAISDPRLKILVAGEGPDRLAIEAWKAESRATHVRLIGHRSERDMLQLLALSDALVLPSLVDPNPLVVVEGLWAGLPLLISRLAGNWPETVHPGVNGWIFDPQDACEVRTTVHQLLDLSSAQRQTLGSHSRHIAEQFATERVVSEFADQLERSTR
jgi:glycosyltransferase involved in cell wall biosynthesis